MSALFYWSSTKSVDIKPNEWGDFFAGVFAPLAFLWLVLGYMQQGEELRLSTQALRLQAEELKNSVEQQRELVEVTRMQLQGERDALEYERLRREAEVKPGLILSPSGGTFRGDGKSTYAFTLANVGNAATALLLDLVLEGVMPKRLLENTVLERGGERRLEFTTPQPLQGHGSRLLLSFKDVVGKQYNTNYSIGRVSDNPHAQLTFTAVEPSLDGDLPPVGSHGVGL